MPHASDIGILYNFTELHEIYQFMLYSASYLHDGLCLSGPPLPPSPTLRVVNATDLQLLWKEPFTSEGYGIKQYNVSVRRSNNTQAFMITDRVFDWSRDDIAQSCEELHFTVTATNDIGNSETANISGEFPVGKSQHAKGDILGE